MFRLIVFCYGSVIRSLRLVISFEVRVNEVSFLVETIDSQRVRMARLRNSRIGSDR